MRKILFVFLLFVLSPLSVFSADGYVFTAKTVEGVEMKFMVISESEKTCEVGTGNYDFFVGNMAITDIHYSGVITIPSRINGYSVVRIGSGAFFRCDSLTVINLPASVTTIGSSAFCYCSSLTSINLPASVTTIGSSAFCYCSSLTSINLPASVTTIGSSAFYDCGSLTSIKIPASLTSIGSSAFSGCSSQTTIKVADGNPVYDSREDCNAIIETATNTLIQGCCNTIIPEGITSIGEGAFYDCGKLTYITIPESVTSIGDRAFSGCHSLTSINLPASVTSIGQSAFSGCSSLTSINLPASVTTIGNEAFSGCSSLTSIRVAEDNPVYDSREDCNALIHTKTSKLIQGCNNTFIPESVKAIGDFALYGCKFSILTIPKNVKSIGQCALCVTTPSIRSYIKEPFAVKDVFYSGSSSYKTLYVPIGSIPAYEQAEGWPKNNIEELIALQPVFEVNGLTVSISTTDADAGIYYTTDGTTPTKESRKYTGPFNATGAVVKAIAVCEYMHDSEVAEQTFPVCKMPELAYSGEGFNLESTSGATIYYTTDGSEPTSEAQVFTGTFAVDDYCTIKAVAVKDDILPSAVLTFPITSLYDGQTLRLSCAGVLQDGIALYGLMSSERLTIKDEADAADFAALRGIASLRHLNVSDVQPVDDRLPDAAFQNMALRSVVLPAGMKQAGDGVFKGCRQLAAVVWGSAAIPQNTFADVDNPHFLLYVNDEQLATTAKAEGIRYIIVNGHIGHLALTDSLSDNAAFYCPQPFKADTVSYTHDYQLQTGIGECRGWETIALPFDVQTVTHERRGELTPTAINDPTKPPFWLYEHGEEGFAPTANIKANTPYLIAMPNNPAYSSEYNLSGKVTFSARNATIPVTEPVLSTSDETTLLPAFERMEAPADLFVLNTEEAYGLPAGSIFVPGQRAIRPFEAYATLQTAQTKEYIPLFDAVQTSVNLPKARQSGEKVYDLSGRLVKGQCYSLKTGLYIVNGKIRSVK